MHFMFVCLFRLSARAPSGSSQFGNQNKNEEGRLKGSGEKEENRSIVHHPY